MVFDLPALPYPADGLEPYISSRTIEFHYGKHHRSYVTTLNHLVEGTPFIGQSPEQIVRQTANDGTRSSIFNNAAQTWNHSFFWKSMRPPGNPTPSGDLLRFIEKSFGTLSNFKEAFKNASVGQFGSGWVWLVLEADALKVIQTPNAMNPLVQSKVALLACDVWEHAYYLDFQNRRADFVQIFLDHLVNWEFVAGNLSAALS